MHLKIGRVSPALSALVFMLGAEYALADSKPAPRAYDSAMQRDVSRAKEHELHPRRLYRKPPVSSSRTGIAGTCLMY